MTLTTLLTLIAGWMVLSVPVSLLAGYYLAAQERMHPPRRVAVKH